MPLTFWIPLGVFAGVTVARYAATLVGLARGQYEVGLVPRDMRPVWFPILAFWFTFYHRKGQTQRPSLYVATWLAIALALFASVQSGNTLAAGVGVVLATWRPLEIVFAHVKLNLWDRGMRRSPARSVGLGFANLVEVVLAIAIWFSVIALDAPRSFGEGVPLGAWESIRLALPLGPSPQIDLQGWEPQFIAVAGTLVLAFVTLFVLAVLASEVASRRADTPDPTSSQTD